MSGGPSELSESTRRQRRGVADAESEADDDSDSDTNTTSRTNDLPEDINANRRNTLASGGDEFSGGGSQAETSDGLPDDINTGRRSATPPEDPTTPGPDTNPNPDETPAAEGETGLGDTPDSPEDAQLQAVGSQLEKEFIRENNDITSRNQVDVENVRRTEDGSFTGDIVLTEAGREAVAENQQAALDRLGTTGRTLLGRQRRVTQERQRQAFEEDVARSTFAQRQLERQIEREQGFQEGTVDVAPTGEGDIDIGLTVGGQRRQLIESAEQQGIPSESVQVVNREDGSMGLELTDEGLRQRAAAQNPDVSADELKVSDQREFQDDAGLFAASGEDVPEGTRRVVELTEGARRERLLEQANEENPDGNFKVIEDETGNQRVVMEERFDDNGAFLGIPGAEDEFQAVADVSTEFLSGVGEGAGKTVGVPLDIASSSLGLTEDGQVADFAGTLGKGGAQVFNIPAGLSAADELGEFIGAGGAAGVNAALEGSFDPLAEFGAEGQAAGRFMAGQLQQQVTENPVETAGLVIGSAVTATGALKLAGSGSSTSGQLVRGLVQPGEEAFAATTGLRPTSAALRGVSSAKSRLPDVNVRSFSRSDRGQFNLETGQSASQRQIDLTGKETAADFDKPVSELNVSESTRTRILENTRQAEAESESVINPEADLSLTSAERRALTEMPPAQAFESPGQFSKSFQRHLARIDESTKTRGTEIDGGSTVTTARTLPLRTVITLGALSATTQANSPDLVDGIEATAQQTPITSIGAESVVSAVEDEQTTVSVEETLAESEAVGQVESTLSETGVEETAVSQTATATQSGLDSVTELQTETATELEGAIDTALETQTETQTQTQTAVETEARLASATDGSDKKREQDLDLDFESELPEDPGGDSDDFEGVFESNVASAEEVLGLDDEQ